MSPNVMRFLIWGLGLPDIKARAESTNKLYNMVVDTKDFIIDGGRQTCLSLLFLLFFSTGFCFRRNLARAIQLLSLTC